MVWDSSCLHLSCFQQICCPSVVHRNWGFLATLDRVGFRKLHALFYNVWI
jgi:hypothetical protein